MMHAREEWTLRNKKTGACTNALRTLTTLTLIEEEDNERDGALWMNSI